MASEYKWIEISDFTGGRNAVDDPFSLAKNQVVQMRNGDTYRTHLFRKKPGAIGPAIGSAFTGVISSLVAHYPAADIGAAELWGMDDAATPIIGRMAAASTFTAPTLTDNPSSGAGPSMRGASYRGRLHLAYKSAQDRTHIYDPTLSAPRVRRQGLRAPGAPASVVSSGAGVGGAEPRMYRCRFRIKSGTEIVAESEPGTASASYSNGGGFVPTISPPATINENETHFFVEASHVVGGVSDGVWYELAGSETAVAGTYTDNYRYDGGSPAWNTNVVAQSAGTFTTFPSVKYLLQAFSRMVGIGSHTASNPQSRLWCSPVFGELNRGDAERYVSTTSRTDYQDIFEGTGGDARGLVGPMYGSIYIFKYFEIHKATPTGVEAPIFDIVTISLTRGALEQECIVLGEDEKGRQAIFFLDSNVGPMMLVAGAPVPIGDHGVRDLWDTVNLAATAAVGWVRDYPKLGQVWFAWATGSSNDPTVIAKYTKATGGWSVDDTGGKVRLGRCSVMFARTPGATMSRDRVPYVGYSAANNKLLRCDTTDLDDDGTTYQAVVKTRALALNGGKLFRTTSPWIVAKPANGVTLTVTVDCDNGRITQAGTISLTPTADEAGSDRIWRRVEGIDAAECHAVQMQIADANAIANSWTIERMYVPVLALEENP